MSSVNNKDIHFQVVQDWENKNKTSLTPAQQVSLLLKGIKAVEQRALKTLSDITLKVILERVLHQSSEKFELLRDVNIDKGFSIDAILNTSKMNDTKKLLEALRYFLIELLRVLGRITAEILTNPLHAELKNVTIDLKDNK